MNNGTINKFHEITLSDLMAEDLDVWVTNNNKFGFDIQIDNDNGDTLVDEKGLHPCAASSFADFCRRYLAFYEAALSKEAA